MNTLPDPDWFVHGVCHSAPNPDIFSPDRRSTGAEAKSYCGRCPVAEQCLRYALANKVNGIWGGTTDADRRRLRGGRPIREVARA